VGHALQARAHVATRTHHQAVPLRILQYTRHPFTNSKTEGINSKIQLIKHRARGYRNRENFRIAILFHRGGLNMDPC
jgi:transposase